MIGWQNDLKRIAAAFERIAAVLERMQDQSEAQDARNAVAGARLLGESERMQ